MEKEISKPALMQLKKMMNKIHMYQGQQFTILNYHVLPDEGKTQIDIRKENGDRDQIQTKDLMKFIDQCLPINTDVEKGDSSAVSTEVVEQTNNLLGTLQQTLLDNIEQVKKNSGYIKQANVVNSSVNSLIGLAKIQIQVSKMKK